MVVMNNNNDNNDDDNIQQEEEEEEHQQQQQPPRVVAAVVAAPQEPQLRNLIQDLDGWLESNGLRSVDDINRSNNNNDTTNNTINNCDTLYISDERQRINNENLYIQTLYNEKIFYYDNIQQQKEYNEKIYTIQQLKHMKMDIITSKSNISNDNDNQNHIENDNNIIRNIPLDRMAYICDTIYIMIQNKQWRQQYNYTWFDNNDNNNNNTSHNQDHNDDTKQSNMTTTTTTTNKNYQLSLTSFSKESVQAFIDVILYETKNHNTNSENENNNNQNNNSTRTTTTTSNTPNNNHDTGSTTGNNIEHEPLPTLSSSSSLVSESTVSSIRTALYNIQNDILLFDICRIGHYLMAQCIVDCIIEIFIISVDIYNCFIIYQFVEEELHLSSTTLIEKCLSYMIDTISTYMENNNENDTTNNNKDNNSDNNNSSNNDSTDIYDIQLKERLIIMKRAMESSIHGYNSGNKNKNSSNNKNQQQQQNHHPSNSDSNDNSTDNSTEQQQQYIKKRIYFTSLEEYLSIFAERVQYYQERLQEAKEQQEQLLIQEQQQYNRTMSNEYGSFSKHGIIPSSKSTMITSSLYNDTQKKIIKQEQRLRTLEIAYAEQKSLFRNHINHDNNENK